MTKKIVLFFLFAAIIAKSNISAQNNADDRKFYESKVAKFTKMRNTGTTLGIFGGVATIAGVVLVANADWHSSNNDYYNNTGYEYSSTTTDSRAIIGIVCLGVGIPMLATGITLGSIGSRKAKFYKNKMNNITMNARYSPQNTLLVLTYNF